MPRQSLGEDFGMKLVNYTPDLCLPMSRKQEMIEPKISFLKMWPVQFLNPIQ